MLALSCGAFSAFPGIVSISGEQTLPSSVLTQLQALTTVVDPSWMGVVGLEGCNCLSHKHVVGSTPKAVC